jgi:hypothetical protein
MIGIFILADHTVQFPLLPDKTHSISGEEYFGAINIVPVLCSLILQKYSSKVHTPL